MTEAAFGQYYPAHSFVHKCDPRLKILFLIVFIVAIFLANNFYALGLVAAAFLLIAALAKIPVKSLLRSVKAVLFLLLFTAVLNLFFYQGSLEKDVLWLEWGIIKIWDGAVYFTLFLAVRLTLLVLTSSLLTLTTTPVSLTDGVESLLYPFKLLRLPVHELALIMSIALRFIPILTDETSRIIQAQKARGADFETGGLIKRVKAMIPVLIPLLLSALRRAEELGDAMDARCYSDSKVRTKYKKLRFGYRDLIAALFACALLTGIILLRIYALPVL